MSLHVIRDKKTRKFYGYIPDELNSSSHEAHWYVQRVQAKAFCFDHGITKNKVDILTKHELEQENNKRIKERNKVRR